MGCYVVELRGVDPAQVALVGGKGAHLGRLSRIEEIQVPAGFCVTTDAFRRILAEAHLDEPIERLSLVSRDDPEKLRETSAEIRRTVEGTSLPDDVEASVRKALAALGDQAAYAVRSSATAEDLPTASFAGQHDSYLNVHGTASVLEHVRRCWASLYTERAVAYRNRIGLDHRKVQMAVVVQRMVSPQAAGVLFTADPATGHRKIASVEAVFGLGEALVRGAAHPDVYKVREGQIVSRAFATQQALKDAQVVRLVELGRRIENQFGCPQDIEWCLVDDDFQFVQSRPITTLFPIPRSSDGQNHVYVSVGHQQMMTDAMKPLGISLWQLTAARPMHEAGGRLFVDVTRDLGAPASRARLLALTGRSDPLVGDALQTLLDRGFVPSLSDETPASASHHARPAPLETDPDVVRELVERCEASIAALKRDIRTKSGVALIDFLLADIQELKRILFDPQSNRVIMAAMEATWWLNEKLQEWLGEKNAADRLTQSVLGNVTSQMGLGLLDVADAIRPHPDLVAFLRNVRDESFLDESPRFEGGSAAQVALRSWLDEYGMRCPGEIDLTRPRWSERPSTLVSLILSNIDTFESGAGQRIFERGRQDASQWEQELLARLRGLEDGERKAEETKRMMDRARTFIGYREYPKYGMVRRYFAYKVALLEEADRLVRAHVLREKEDIYYLTLEELQDVVRTNRVDAELLRERKDAFRSHQLLTPPRVLTSDGEAIAGVYRRGDAPPGTLIGLPVSAGTVEGRARVVLDLARADIEPGDILVTTWTDPSWTPLFVAIKGLVTEVGGQMTHGAVIAREYGLPAVTGVEHATRLIQDGQRIRVHGTAGFIELLPYRPDA